MPRIDPLQLLRCLSVLLAPNGGILSKDQVCRLASLMTKFSKKLVSKCIYVQILKNTKAELIGMFMSEGGWGLTNSWLADAIEARNWPLMQELLELLLMCPVDVERLKLNNCPKLVKGLSKDPTNKNVQLLASRLVEQWLQIVKGPGGISQPLSLPSPQPLGNAQLPVAVVQPMVQSQLPASQMLVTLPPEAAVSEAVHAAYPSACAAAGHASTVSDIEMTRDDVEMSEVKSDVESEPSNLTASESNIEELLPEHLRNEVEPMETDSGVISNGEPVDKIVLKFTTNGKKVIIRSPGKRAHSEEDDEASPVKKKKDVVKDKRKVDKERPDAEKSLSKHDKVEKSDKKGLDRRPSKDSHKSESKSKHHHHGDKSKEKERSRDKEKEKSKVTSSSSIKEREKEKERERLKEKGKDKERKDKIKEKSETQADKDRATLAKIMQPSVSKLGKIPKKSDSSNKPTDKGSQPVLSDKKFSISIENRKNTGEARPKTVKTFNSKFRSTGLEEEVKPPPPRKEVKKTPNSIAVPSTGSLEKKDPLPSSLPSTPQEKRVKPTLNLSDPPKRPGAIKLIPAKPKPPVLQDSDFFMDALTAANVKREPRKKVKRRISGSKDEPISPTNTSTPSNQQSDGSASPNSSPASSPERERPERPAEVKPVFKFYQETLQLNEEIKTEEEDSEEKKESPCEGKPVEEASPKIEVEKEEEKEDKVTPVKSPQRSPVSHSPSDVAMIEREKNRLPRGVLVFHRSSRGPKKSLKWKSESDLESVHYFELDETERVNVTKTSFMDMKQMERINERENFHLSRRMSGEDQMREHMSWSRLIPIDLPPSEVEHGSKSREKDIQFAREKTVTAVPFFGKNMGPDTAIEPDFEHHPVTDPVIIPLEDVTGPNSVNDFTATPWPESKPLLIPQSPPHSHTISHQVPVGPSQSAPLLHTPFHAAGGDWRTGDGKVVIPDMGMVGPVMVPMGPNMGPGMGQPMMGPGMGQPMMGPGMGQPMMGPAMNMGGPGDMYNNQNGMDGGNWGPDMNYGMMGGGGPEMGGPFPMDQGGYDMYQGQGYGPGPGGPGGHHMGPGNFRGRGGRGWFRGGGGESWRGGRGRGGWGGPGGPKRVPPICRYFKKGNCQTVNCMFQHPAELKSGRH